MKQTLVQKFALVELISIKWTFAYSKIRLMQIFPSPKNRKMWVLCVFDQPDFYITFYSTMIHEA